MITYEEFSEIATNEGITVSYPRWSWDMTQTQKTKAQPTVFLNEDDPDALIRLNDSGKAVWRHRLHRNLFADRSYEWCDRIIILDESDSRRLIDDTAFSTFDLTDWIPLTLLEYQKVQRCYKEIYDVPDPG